MSRGVATRWLFLLLVGAFLALPSLLMPYSMWNVMSHLEGTSDRSASFECALIFGAAVHSTQDPGPAILRRVQEGVRLFRAGRVERLIFTGGRGNALQRSEASVMRSVAESAGVSSGVILLEENSSSTKENLHNVKPLLADCSSTVGISDPYHLARIGLLADQEGISLSLHPTDAPIYTGFLLESIFRESLGYAYYIVRDLL